MNIACKGYLQLELTVLSYIYSNLTALKYVLEVERLQIANEKVLISFKNMESWPRALFFQIRRKVIQKSRVEKSRLDNRSQNLDN